MIEVVPQYDSNGLDSGLWAVSNPDALVNYYNLALGMTPVGTLAVGQYPDWDNESYTEFGDIEADYKHIGTLECPNPYQNDDAAARLYEWLIKSEAVAE